MPSILNRRLLVATFAILAISLPRFAAAQTLPTLRGAPTGYPSMVATTGALSEDLLLLSPTPTSDDGATRALGRLQGGIAADGQYLAKGSGIAAYARIADPTNPIWVGPYPIPIRDVDYARGVGVYKAQQRAIKRGVSYTGLRHFQFKTYQAVSVTKRTSSTGDKLVMIATTDTGELVYMDRLASKDYMWNGPIWEAGYILNPTPDDDYNPSPDPVAARGVPAIVETVWGTTKRLDVFVPGPTGIRHFICNEPWVVCQRPYWAEQPSVGNGRVFGAVAAFQSGPDQPIRLAGRSQGGVYLYERGSNQMWGPEQLVTGSGVNGTGNLVFLTADQLVAPNQNGGLVTLTKGQNGWTSAGALGATLGTLQAVAAAQTGAGTVLTAQRQITDYALRPSNVLSLVHRPASAWTVADPELAGPWDDDAPAGASGFSQAYSQHLGALTRADDPASHDLATYGGANDLGTINVQGSGSTNVFEVDDQLVIFFGDARSAGAGQNGADFWGTTDKTLAQPLWHAAFPPTLAGMPTYAAPPVDLGSTMQKVRIAGQPPGGFEVPTGAIADGDSIYVFFITDFHDAYPSEDVVVEPEYNTTMMIGHTSDGVSGLSAMSRAAPPAYAHRFGHIRPLRSGNFVYLYGTGEPKRMSPIFLARVNVSTNFDDIADRSKWSYLMGKRNGVNVWSNRGEGVAYPLTRDACMQEVSIVDAPLDKLLMTLQCPLYDVEHRLTKRGIFFQTASGPAGPWSASDGVTDDDAFSQPDSTTDDGLGITAHAPIIKANGDISIDDGLGETDGQMHGDEDKSGGAFGAYLIPSWSTNHGNGSYSLVHVVSTWNPYKVQLFRTVLFDTASAAPTRPSHTIFNMDPLNNGAFTSDLQSWSGNPSSFARVTAGSAIANLGQCPSGAVNCVASCPNPASCDATATGHLYQIFRVGNETAIELAVTGGGDESTFIALRNCLSTNYMECVDMLNRPRWDRFETVRKSYATPPGTANATWDAITVHWDVQQFRGRFMMLSIVDNSTSEAFMVRGATLN